MKKPPPRIQMLGAGLAIVSVAWTLDMFTGPIPAAASAAPGIRPVVLNVPMPADPPDRAPLEAFLSRSGGPDHPLQADEDLREVFAPTSRFKLAGTTASPTVSPLAEAAPRDDRPAASDSFSATHKLQAILMSRRPMAMINDRLHLRGAEIDGFRIDRITRDRVFLSGPGGRVELVMPAPALRRREADGSDGPS